MSNQQITWQAESNLGVIAAGGAAAVAAGMEIFKMGGNAADAAVATLLALMVTDHGECSIGGEVPLIIFDANKQEVKVLSGQGGAPLSQDAIAWYMQNGIPEEGNIKIAPVPSVVDLCVTALQQHGTKTLADVTAPTLELLDGGDESWHPNLAMTLSRMIEEEQVTLGSREERLQAACDRFYGRNKHPSDIAEDLESFYIENGGFLRRIDLATHKTLVEDPISVNYRGYTIYKCGPWTQGPYLCQTLGLLEGFEIQALGHLSADYVHVAVEAIKLAMADRDAYYGDPNYVYVPLDALLSDEYTRIRRPLIEMDKASHEVRPGDPYEMNPIKNGGLIQPGIGGTTTCVVADRWGNMVAATPSANVFEENPQGGKAGVTFGNRLRSLNTTPGHPNCIAPGKRPRITLTPTMVLKDGKPILAISVAGGDLQDQVTLNLLLNFIDFGLLPEKAVKTARFATTHHEDSFNPDVDRPRTFGNFGSLIINDTVSQQVRDELASRGHEVETQSQPIASPVILYIDHQNGKFFAAGDPAAGRHAAGL